LIPLKITNHDARRLWLSTNGLGKTPMGPLDLMALIRRLGFVQIDTIRNVTRAHHHILWSRNQNYREHMLWPKLKTDRTIFEHFTHDASLIPMEFLPMWQRQFRRLGDKAARHEWYQSGLAQQQIRDIHERIRAEGPLSTHAFDTKHTGPREMWARPPHKKALDQMWYAGRLATSHRENFTKFYDLGERVFPTPSDETSIGDQQQIDRLCKTAHDRLGTATPGEIQRFWGATDAAEVKDWIVGQSDLIPVEMENADQSLTLALATPDIETRLANAPAPTSRLRIINPFDPLIRDRARLLRLFGFDYRNEMFVPANKRIWGYYVYPLLERDRFVGRMEIKADRAAGRMQVTGFWPEPGTKWGKARFDRLDQELHRFARLAGINHLGWDCRRT